MSTSLTSDKCHSVGEANNVFAAQRGLLILRPKSRSCISFSFTIPSGCYALVTHHSSDLDYMDEDGNRCAVWPAGLHFPYSPWIGVSYLVTKQSIVLDLPAATYKTKDNINVNIDVSLTFRIMGDPELGEDSYLVRKFVYERRPSGLQKQLTDAHEEAVRALVRLLDHTEVYGIRSSAKVGLDSKAGKDRDIDDFSYFLSGSSSGSDPSGESEFTLAGVEDSRGVRLFNRGAHHNATDIIRKRLNRQFILQGVQILSVVIKNVTLPEEFQSQMEKRTLSISERVEQQILHKDATQSTRMEEEMQAVIQTFSEEREQETQSGLKDINTETVKLNDAVSQAKKSESIIREEKKVRMGNFVAQNEYATQRVKDSTDASISAIELKTKRLASELTAITQLECQSCLSEASLLSTKNEIMADKELTKAEGVTANWTKVSKQFMADLKKIDVLDCLGNNKDFILGGNSDGDTHTAMIAEKILEDNSIQTSEPSPTSVAAEAAVLRFAFDRGDNSEDSTQPQTTIVKSPPTTPMPPV